MKEMTNIRVLHVITGTSIGGAERMLQKLLTALDRGKYVPIVISLTSRGPVGEEIEAAGIPLISLGAGGYLGMLQGIQRLIKEANIFRPHIVQGWMYHGNLAATIIARFNRNAPAVIWNVRHSLDDMKREKTMTRFLINALSHFSSKPACVLYNAETSARQHHAIGYACENSRVIPNGFNCDRFRPDAEARRRIREEWGIEDGMPVVGLVARFHPHKDFTTFLRAAAVLKKQSPYVRFVLAGSGVTEENSVLRNLIHSFGLDASVQLLGPRHDVNRVMCGFDIFSLSSTTEGFPNTIGEAMACGVPCVSTRVGDAEWIIGESGTVVPSGDPGALADAWNRLILSGADRRVALGAMARQRISTSFSMEAVASQYAALYDETMAKQLSR